MQYDNVKEEDLVLALKAKLDSEGIDCLILENVYDIDLRFKNGNYVVNDRYNGVYYYDLDMNKAIEVVEALISLRKYRSNNLFE